MSEKGYTATTMTFYAVTYAELSRVARDKGYALCLHGSLRKDLDILAVPWVEKAASEDELVKAIVEAAGGALISIGDKPHGRRSFTIVLGGCSATVPPDERASYIDLCVMPRGESPRFGDSPELTQLRAEVEMLKGDLRAANAVAQMIGSERQMLEAERDQLKQENARLREGLPIGGFTHVAYPSTL